MSDDAELGKPNDLVARVLEARKNQKPPPTVILYALETMGLIIPWSSGVHYRQQSGGYMCCPDLVEGVFVPLNDDGGYAEKLYQYFFGPKWSGWCSDGIDAETADFVDAILAEALKFSEIKVDRSRLEDSREAWVYVVMADPHSSYLIEGFSSGNAILTWPNSD